MTEQQDKDYLQNNDYPPRYEIPWIFRLSLVMLATCGLLAILAVAFKSSSTVKTDVSSQSGSVAKILPLPTKKIFPSIQNIPPNQTIIKPQNQRETVTVNQGIVITQSPGENPTSKIKQSSIPNSQSPNPDSQILTTSTITQNLPIQPESIVISEAIKNPEKTVEPTPESSPKPTIEQQSIEDEPGVELTLSEVVFLGLENNRDIKNQYLERIAQKQDLAVAEGQFVPIFTPQVSVSALRLRSGESAATGEVDLSAKVSVKIPSGGEIGFSWAAQRQRQDANGFGINSEGSLSQNLQLSFNQPLLRGAGVAVNRAPIEIARLNEKINILTLRSTLIDTITSAILSYRELIKAQEQVKISQSSLEIARQQLEINQALIEAGRLAKVEIFTSEKAVADQEVAVLASEEQLKRARLALLQILDLDRNLNIIAVEVTPQEEKPLDFNNIIKLALSNSPDYLQAQLNREIAKYSLLVAENNRKWNLGVNASYNNNASNFSDSNSEVRAGLVLTHEFGNRRIEQEFQRRRVNLLKSENDLKERNQKLEVEVRNAIRDVNLNLRQVELAQRSRELAERQLEIEQDKRRLGVGSSRSIDIVTFQNALIDARNAELNARINYLNALTNLDKIIGTTLDTWQVMIENK
ncbi:TolC family protein [Kamptonema sp. UHCC 0994]|uniref:TolC family protein n=1 Tax=Kamptonema sp. UHCC 0994 TaxID=3031329 RepID=UPI0023BA2187|nr:TolC family protein [Kamptonema sp. UHCC 0994]MDF0555792.1 TolC family protein [Kamptonema sp. UHCC 0994]